MARADLSNLLGAIGRNDTAPSATEVAAITAPDRHPVPQHSKPATPTVASSTPPVSTAPSEPAPGPKSETAHRSEPRAFDDFERKEARLRPDQYETLTVNARRLNKLKGTGGVRITENTLIRVAIDMLIARLPELRGATEDELRKSVGL